MWMLSNQNLVSRFVGIFFSFSIQESHISSIQSHHSMNDILLTIYKLREKLGCNFLCKLMRNMNSHYGHSSEHIRTETNFLISISNWFQWCTLNTFFFCKSFITAKQNWKWKAKKKLPKTNTKYVHLIEHGFFLVRNERVHSLIKFEKCSSKLYKWP